MEAQSTPQPTTDLTTSNQQLTTVISRHWTDDWISKVAETEARLGHPICGSRTISGNPCELHPNHPNGRCKFHGGFDLTGAPKGNRNAMIHGLYSRRLRTCSPDCPQWKQCPCATPEVAAIKPTEQPTCPYEQTEYNTALTDFISMLDNAPFRYEFTRHLAHNMALLQVMLGRAAISMRNDDLVDNPNTPSLRGGAPAPTRQSPGYVEEAILAGSVEDAATPTASEPTPAPPNAPRPRPSAKLQAFLRIQSELRRTLRLLLPKEPVDTSPSDQRTRYARSMLDDDTTLESNAHRDLWDYIPPGDYTTALYKCSNAQNNADFNHRISIKYLTEACKLSQEAAYERKDEIIAAYKPHKGGMTQQEFTQKINELLPP